MDVVVSAEDILRAIERERGYEVGSLWIDRGDVWRRDDDGDLKSVCIVGSQGWDEYRAAELAYRVVLEIKGLPASLRARDRGRAAPGR